MTVLSSEQRKLLSDVVVRARELVEPACAQRITALGVAADKAPAMLTEDERAVRVGLRARARQLGSIDSLVAEAGFEHWHRMLFARFLADNGLLIDDQFGQALTMDEIAEYAAETGEADQWEVAARFAAAMLPGIFTQGDPVLAMRLPLEARDGLERLLDRLPLDVITAEDSLGWVYQYWQAKRKAEVNSSERKIGGADLAPVTQLFTENYMVRFLLENSLGAWWAAGHPDSPLMAGWEYLRRSEDGSPAVGGFDGWPQLAAEVTVMDPCCGSGHFLTAAFGMLWRMRAEEEGLASADAQDAVLRDNLFGLELDPRCTQLAMFALALEAWKAGGYRPLPLPNVACCGIPTRAPLSDWLDLAGGEPPVEAALTRLHALFANADTLGSLIDPVRATEQAGLESVDWHQVAPLVQKALGAEGGQHATDPSAAVFGHAAVGIARAADYLSRSYTLISTNPPWLNIQKMDATLTDFVRAEEPAASAELAIALGSRFLDRAASEALVLPTTWMFLTPYRRYRREMLEARRLMVVADLGPGAFAGISGEVVKAALVIVGTHRPHRGHSTLMAQLSAAESKAHALRLGTFQAVPQVDQLSMPDTVLSFSGITSSAYLHQYAASFLGVCTGDNKRFTRKNWEIPSVDHGWERMTGAPDARDYYTGRDEILLWEHGRGRLHRFIGERLGVGSEGAWIRNLHTWGSRGIALSRAGRFSSTLYHGGPFLDGMALLVPDSQSDLAALWCFVGSEEFRASLRAINPKVVVTVSSITNVPFDSAHWRAVAEERFPDGLPEPFSNDPTQWLFQGDVMSSRFPLQVAVARLLGFRWPGQEPDPLDSLSDSDGVVCLPGLGGESAADERLRTVLAMAYGDSWSTHILDALLIEAGSKPGAARLDRWLRDDFAKNHCAIFANRPFIWQIWDGRPDGFSALVNYHKLDRKLLERLTYDYLGSWWIGRLSDEVRQQIPGAEARLVAAEELKAKLQLILEGEPPYDIYVRWKSLAEQPMGWEPDVDDGVRLNIRPFMTAGVLRAKPNIKWEKDRGKNPDGTDRFNDLHFTLAEKRAARGGAGL